MSSILKVISPVNVTYALTYEPLVDDSFQIHIEKRVNGIIDPTISPINKKFFFSKTYESLIKLDLHRMYDKKMVLKKDNEEKKFSYIFELCDYVYTTARSSISLQRYKGLGEMNPSQLAETTMNPSTRSLLQVSQINDEDYVIFDTLMGDDVEKRRDFIVSSANVVETVDV